MTKRIRLLFCIVVAVISQNAQSDTEKVVTSSAEQSALNAFLLEPFEEPLGYSMVLFDAKAQIIRRFGKPNSKSSASYPSRTSDENLWLTKLEYNGITFIVGEAEDRTTSWLDSISIRSDEHLLVYGLRVGSTRKDVLDAFHDSPHGEYDGQLRFASAIWETRTDTEHRPGEDVTLEAYIELTVEIGEDGQVTEYLFENIEF